MTTMQTTVQCHFCEQINAQNSLFCKKCGSPSHLAPCPICEAVNPLTANACYKCQSALDFKTIFFNDDAAVAENNSAALKVPTAQAATPSHPSTTAFLPAAEIQHAAAGSAEQATNVTDVIQPVTADAPRGYSRKYRKKSQGISHRKLRFFFIGLPIVLIAALAFFMFRYTPKTASPVAQIPTAALPLNTPTAAVPAINAPEPVTNMTSGVAPANSASGALPSKPSNITKAVDIKPATKPAPKVIPKPVAKTPPLPAVNPKPASKPAPKPVLKTPQPSPVTVAAPAAPSASVPLTAKPAPAICTEAVAALGLCKQ